MIHLSHSAAIFAVIAATAIAGDPCSVAHADEFVIQTEKGRSELEGRIVETGPYTWIEGRDGQIHFPNRVVERTPAEFAPFTAEEAGQELANEFDEELLRTYISGNNVTALVAGYPLSSAEQKRADIVLKSATNFFQQVARVFGIFLKKNRFRHTDPEYPLVVILFENDEDFEKYSERDRNSARSVTTVSGYYSHGTNRLVIRLSECDDFRTPLHEAIHQFCFNSGLVKRLADLPSWWVEGIACGFANNGTRIDLGPSALNVRYGKMVLANPNLRWDSLVADGNGFFQQTAGVSVAYAHAWALHWHLVTHYAKEYREFVLSLQSASASDETTVDERREQFITAFGKSPAAMQEECMQVLNQQMSRRRFDPTEDQIAGVAQNSDNYAATDLRAVSLGGVMLVGGRMQNISLIRNLAFHVRVETTGGLYCEWYYPSVAPRAWVPLQRMTPDKLMRNSPGQRGAGTFRVMVDYAIPGSEKAQQWAQGGFEVPIFQP
ncbi:DUF1570 domain-containing protein [Calycomorphotria hydatis]|uniref:DUF1570 domain-containing protein n=1 Tax=Calycomorphotria hydatis TaxID=2528027 RepID=A0A517TAP0_9PLAN|nr:DUF1570 domain-containing protein [Calycomorphotria hydatis]QDT65432.1 hypothetical protein V22_26850 [Calycomorphotria hydatis]